MKHLAIPILLLALVFMSCHEDHHIKLEKNGAADVIYVYQYGSNDSATRNPFDTIGVSALLDTLLWACDSLYANPIITNYERKSTHNGIEIKYRISDVNRLGEFLTPSKGVPVTFKRTRHSLTIDAGNGDADPEDDIGGYTNMITFKLTIELPEKIKSVTNSSGLPVVYSGNVFTIESSVGAVNYSGKRNLVVIKY